MTTCNASTTPFPRLSHGLTLVLGGLLVFCALQGKAQQQDTVYQLDAVTVQGQNEIPAVQSIAPVQSMDAERLESMPAVQVSDVLKLFSGVVIKDYGSRQQKEPPTAHAPVVLSLDNDGMKNADT